MFPGRRECRLWTYLVRLPLQMLETMTAPLPWMREIVATKIGTDDIKMTRAGSEGRTGLRLWTNLCFEGVCTKFLSDKAAETTLEIFRDIVNDI